MKRKLLFMHSAGSTFDSRLGRQETKPVLCFYFGPSLLSRLLLCYEAGFVKPTVYWLRLVGAFWNGFWSILKSKYTVHKNRTYGILADNHLP
jgi:hypothetical protein